MTAFTGPADSVTDERGSALPVDRLRRDFPILLSKVRGRPLVYLDNAATTQKPETVIRTVADYYRETNANVHRAVYGLSDAATQLYEGAREKVRRFINARSTREIIFVRGATEGINLVAQSFGRSQLAGGDEIVVSEMEHHSNIVPWQIVCEQTGAKLRVIPVDDRGQLEVADFGNLLGPRAKIVALTHVSNALGTINPVREVIELAHERCVPVLLDGAQSVPHMPVDVQTLDCDFYVFSGHKMFGPTGIGILYARQHLLESMPPYQSGGDMIRAVTFKETTYHRLPHKFEAGTPNIAGAIGLGAAVDYLESVGMDRISEHEADLLAYATERLAEIPGLRIIGTARDKTAVVSFVLDGLHPHDLGTILDEQGIAIRTGHHCAMPLMDRFGVSATARASFAFYNTVEEIDGLVAGILRAREVLPS